MTQRLIALIPARAGSKGIPKKNIKDLGGHPLIAYSIMACKVSALISEVYVSTDSEEIASIAKSYGASVPFLRPTEFAQDTSSDLEVIQHFFTKISPQDFALIRPTTPLRDPDLLDSFIEIFYQNYDTITSMRSAHELPESPYKLFKIENGVFAGFFDDFNGVKDYSNLPRQTFPKAYQPNGYIDILKKDVVLSGKDFGSKILPAITPAVIEADILSDFEMLKIKASISENILARLFHDDKN